MTALQSTSVHAACVAGLSTKLTQNCSVTIGQQLTLLVDMCQLDVESDDLPIPVWPLAAFPEVGITLDHSFQAFLSLQAQYNASTISLGGGIDGIPEVNVSTNEASQAANSSINQAT